MKGPKQRSLAFTIATVLSLFLSGAGIECGTLCPYQPRVYPVGVRPLSVVAADFDGADGSDLAVADSNVGEVSLLPAGTLDMNQPGSFTLFTASFDVLGSGAGTFDIDQMTAVLGDANGMALPLDEVIPATVAAAAAPIPTLSQWGLLLFVSVLLFAGLHRLRRSLA